MHAPERVMFPPAEMQAEFMHSSVTWGHCTPVTAKAPEIRRDNIMSNKPALCMGFVCGREFLRVVLF
jgi:hypothetical protein